MRVMSVAGALTIILLAFPGISQQKATSVPARADRNTLPASLPNPTLDDKAPIPVFALETAGIQFFTPQSTDVACWYHPEGDACPAYYYACGTNGEDVKAACEGETHKTCVAASGGTHPACNR